MELSEEGFSQLAAILESGSDLSEEDGDLHNSPKEDALLQEADETREKLANFQQASEALLAELNSLEAEYEIEKRCREQAEAYAAQINRENKQLKRISAALLPRLGHLPGDLVSLGHEEEVTSEPALDLVGQYLQQIKELQARVSHLLCEKKELSGQVKELQDCIQRLQEQLEEESSKKQSLKAFVKHHQQILKRVRQASWLVTKEYGEVSRQLDLEQELRQQAEEFAHQMLVKQEEAKRQSVILLQGAGADSQLLHALDEVAKLTQVLEGAKLEHQAKVKDLEAQLAERPQPHEVCKLQVALATAVEKHVCLERQLLQAEERETMLRERVKLLEEKVKLMGAAPPGPCCPTAPPPPLPPPPPPPPPLPPCPTPVDPLLAIRQRKGACQVRQPETLEHSTDSSKAKAVEEMMARIRSGVVLRSTRGGTEASARGQLAAAAAASKRRSAVMELQGLLSAMQRPARKASRHKSSQKNRDKQLEAILQRRRRIVDSPGHSQAQQQGPAPEATAGHGILVHPGSTTSGAHRTPEAEFQGIIPHPNMPCPTDTNQILPGDPNKMANKPPQHLEKSPTPVQSLQTRQPMVPSSGSKA